MVASATAGMLAWRMLRLDGDPVEAWTGRLLLGLCLCGVLAISLGSYSLRWTQTALAAVALGGLATEFLIRSRRPGASPAASPPDPYTWLEVAGLTTIGAALFLALLSALAPVTDWDAAAVHLALPSAYARESRIVFEPGNVYSGYPHLMHALYAVALYHGGEPLVSLLNWAFAGLACGAVYSLGRRMASRRCGIVAAAILASAPIFMDQAGGVSIDLAFSALATAALSALAAWFEQRKWGWLILSAMLAGSGCGVRHTGYLVCALLGMAVLLGTRPKRLHAAILFGAVAALAAGPWLLRSALVTGEPLFPFPLRHFPAAALDYLSITGPGAHESIAATGGISWRALIRFPYDIVVHPDRYDGWTQSPGGLVLILGVPGLLLGGWRVWCLGAYTAAGGLFFFFFQRLARYLLPFFTPMMVAAALAESRLPALRRIIAGLLLFSFAYGLALHAAAMYYKIPVLLGLETRAEYLTDRVERYPAFQFANEILNDGGTILTIDPRTYYLDAPAYQNHAGLQRVATWPLRHQVQWLHEHHIKYVMLPLDFIHESSELRNTLAPMLETWRKAPQYFQPVKSLNVPRRGGNSLERVEFYRVIDPSMSAAAGSLSAMPMAWTRFPAGIPAKEVLQEIRNQPLLALGV
jgi:4-amino-4-deoxy-L-arabinose transferase-like glycosyltransferase